MAGGGAPRPAMLPGISHDCCSTRSSAMRRGDAAQVAGHRVAGAAGFVEVRLARLGVADDDASAASGATRRSRRRGTSAGSGDVGHLIRLEGELRHGAAALLDHRTDQFAVLVGEHDRRAQQARPAVAAARILAVAEGAVDLVQRVPRSSAAGSPGGRTGYAPIPTPPIRPRPPSGGAAGCCAASAAPSVQRHASESPRADDLVTAAQAITAQKSITSVR